MKKTSVRKNLLTTLQQIQQSTLEHHLCIRNPPTISLRNKAHCPQRVDTDEVLQSAPLFIVAPRLLLCLQVGRPCNRDLTAVYNALQSRELLVVLMCQPTSCDIWCRKGQYSFCQLGKVLKPDPKCLSYCFMCNMKPVCKVLERCSGVAS